MAIDTILTRYAKSKRAAGEERLEAHIKADALTGIVIGWAEATGHVPRSFTQAHRIKTSGNGPTDRPSSPSAGTAMPGAEPTKGGTLGNTGAIMHGAHPDGTLEAEGATARTSEGVSCAPDEIDTEPAFGTTAAVAHGDLSANTDTDTDAAAKDDGFLPGFAEVDQARDAFAAFLRSPEGLPAPTGPTHPTGAGQHTGFHARVGVQVNVVITDLALFGIQDTPAEVFGLGPVPAETARTMIATATANHQATLKRLYTDPASGALVAMESKSRTFPDGLAQMIGFRDKFCRHPYCNSPIKHLDHITPHVTGGPTSFANGQGLCARHNLIKDSGNTTATPQPAGPTPASTGTAPAPDGTDPSPIGTTSSPDGTGPTPNGTTPLPNGTGPITTRLPSGASFTSPARPFPHENPNTIDSTLYWTGYRAGTAAAETTLTRREELMQLGQDANYAFADQLKKAAEHAKKVRTCLADEYQELTRLQAEQERDAKELQRQRESLDHDANALGRLRTHVEALLTDHATQRDESEAQPANGETPHAYIEAPSSGLESQLHAWALSVPAVDIHHSATAFVVAGMAATLKLTAPTP